MGLIFLDHRFTIPNFPSRLLGYIQARLPVLACTDPNTDIGNIITLGGFGWWCESDSVVKFSEMLNSVLDSELDKMGDIGFDYLRTNYTAEKAYTIITNR